VPPIAEEVRAVLVTRRALLAYDYEMLHYHRGWADGSLRPITLAAGKRIRPLLCLMSCAAVGGDPTSALPAAAAVEILHNFSLVHDDIQDGDETRRHRPTLWALWGVPQAINVGDGMFALAYASLVRAKVSSSIDLLPDPAGNNSWTLKTFERFTEICIRLTEGQHLDLSFEEREDVTAAEYLRMIEGKTAALIAGSLALGAQFGGAGHRKSECLYQFGHNIGMAFQIQDDILGIWGDPEVTGKPAGNDILRRKKSLPLLYGLEHPTHGDGIRSLWRRGIREDELPDAIALLDRTAARNWSEEQVRRYHSKGRQALQEGMDDESDSSLLLGLAGRLLQRQS